MALPPCHMMCQFYVADGKLSCQLYQRSCDIGLGVPFNIASYALLTIIIANCCGLEPGDFVHTLGDAHIYTDHIEVLKIQKDRQPRQFPKIFIKEEAKGKRFDEFVYEDFVLENYNPHPKIAMKMSV